MVAFSADDGDRSRRTDDDDVRYDAGEQRRRRSSSDARRSCGGGGGDRRCPLFCSLHGASAVELHVPPVAVLDPMAESVVDISGTLNRVLTA